MREWCFRMRGGLWTLLFVIILFMVRVTSPAQVISCIVLVVLGQLWRCWSAGYIGLYRGENVKANKLATTGPYALMRNPLYFGNFVIGLGWSVMAGVKGMIIFTVCFVILYAVIIIPHEEQFLSAKFGREYEDYCRRVKRFRPAKLALRDLKGNFDVSVLMRSEIHTIISTVIATVIVFAAAWWRAL